MGVESTVMTGEGGQSLLEFLFMLPVMLFITVLMIKVNTLIQIGIVNQKYSRAQIHFLTYNSPNFPQLIHATVGGGPPATDRLELGVSGNELDEGTGERPVPEATVYALNRKGKPKGNDDPGEDHRERGNVRVRNTVIMCSKFMSGNYTLERQGPEFSEGMRPTFCRGAF